MSGEIIVSVDTDDTRTVQAIDQLEARLLAYTGPAALAAAQAVQKTTKDNLSQRSHGPYEFSNNGAGTPPAMVSGGLRDSVVAIPSGPESAKVGPTARQARILELGGEMHGNPYMEYRKHSMRKGGIVHFKSQFVRLAPMPYFFPAVQKNIDDGAIEAAFVRWWTFAMED